MRAPVGIVGRYVMRKFMRGEGAERKEVEEPCEVVACEYAAGYCWRLLVATHDGYLISVEYGSSLRLVPTPNTEGGPYR